uniref:glutamate carboxypeptidase II n=1 Tax=Phallusia mammillata TaxID=59560 RepID=A0A6F9DCH1_9ASCI|nr:putative N-acetylated-alpha-linked acidic dipeptidase [Phallusia mammillata]
MTSNYSSPLIPLEDSSEEFAIEYSAEKYGSDELGFRQNHTPYRKTSSVAITKRSLFCWSIFGATMVFIIGVLIGRFVFAPKLPETKPKVAEVVPLQKQYTYSEMKKMLFNEMKAENIEKNLKFLTKNTHIAGSMKNEEVLVKDITDAWNVQLDKVEVYPYNVLLSYPNSSSPNYVGVMFPNGTVTRKSNWTETPFTTSEKQDDVIHVFNAYGAAGDATGHLFYVNYGRIEDYELLVKQGVNVTSGICMARYGKIFRGDKARLAELNKCAGLVIFNDPLDFAGQKKHTWNSQKGGKDVYPNSWWLPPSGVQRGSLHLNGDPLTPDYPALNITYRIPESESFLPTIPVQPIGYEDAYQLLSILGGNDAPSDWQGGMDFTYKFGGQFDENHKYCKAHIHVANYRERRTIKTVIGYIRGWHEPDRYVLLGNHRDAWTFGGLDPSSGTAVMLEVARAMSMHVKNGKWRPRRTIVFCSWGAEEYGLIGSTEWVEQMEKMLFLRAVSYFNIDIAVQGTGAFRALSTPGLGKLLFDVTKDVPNPDAKEIKQKRPSVYDTWLAKNFDFDDKTKPYIANIGSGSDYTSFLQKTGVASADIRYNYLYHNISSYPVYHSVHDTFAYMKQFIDPEFSYSLAIARVAAGLLIRTGDACVLPFKPTDYADKLAKLASLLQKQSGTVLDQHSISLENLHWAIHQFKEAATKMDAKVQLINSTSDLIHVRQINDKLFQINRGFIDFNGVPGRHYYRHTIFAPSSHDSYSGAAFPGIVDTIFVAKRGGSWDDVKKEISIVSLQILAAANLMAD